VASKVFMTEAITHFLNW